MILETKAGVVVLSLAAVGAVGAWAAGAITTAMQSTGVPSSELLWQVGGAIVRLEQDPETGAIVGYRPELIRYFNTGYYAGRWSHSGPVTLPERKTG